MNATNPIEISKNLRIAAEKLLSSGIAKLLQGYGEVVYSGSYYLNLMAWPDIDICLPLLDSPEFEKEFLDLGPQLYSVCDLISLRYLNTLRYPEPKYPSGLYWGVYVNQNSQIKWKLDIWAVPRQAIAENQAEMNRLKAKLSLETSGTIISVKQALLTPEGRTPALSGYHIYCAVIDHGLRSLKDIKEYLQAHGVCM
jgi:hypothetical protein